MEPDEALERLGTRETELARVAARGRRRALVIMLLGCVPALVLVGWLNHDASLVALIPIVTVLPGLWYSWLKWARRPEDSQSVAFVGLDRSQRRLVYCSVATGSPLDDPIVLTIVGSMQQHMERTGWMAALAVAGITASVCLLIGGSGTPSWPAITAVLAAGTLAIAGGWWLTRRTGQVMRRSGVGA